MSTIYMDVDAALTGVPVNSVPLTDDTDYKTVEESVAYNAAGLELIWHFTTTAGTTTSTVVTPTTGGDYDWVHKDGGMYTIEIPASGGASINNDTEGFGYFTGKATGVLPWRGPTICFRAAGLNNLLVDDSFSATRGLAGTALPNAAADAAGGLPISDAGGLDLDTKLANTNEVTAARMGALTDLIDGGRLDLLIDAIKAKTDNLPASPAAVGSQMTLSDGAITAAKIASNAITAVKIADDAITSAKLAADSIGSSQLATSAVSEIQNNLATAAKLLAYFQLLVRKDAEVAADLSTELGEINANTGTGVGSYDNTTDSEQAIRDRGDSAWATATSVTVSDKTGFSLATEPPTADENAAGLLDLANGVEDSYTVRQLFRFLLALSAGDSTNGGKDYANPAGTKTRIQSTIDGSNNRTVTSRDVT